ANATPAWVSIYNRTHDFGAARRLDRLALPADVLALRLSARPAADGALSGAAGALKVRDAAGGVAATCRADAWCNQTFEKPAKGGWGLAFDPGQGALVVTLEIAMAPYAKPPDAMDVYAGARSTDDTDVEGFVLLPGYDGLAYSFEASSPLGTGLVTGAGARLALRDPSGSSTTICDFTLQERCEGDLDVAPAQAGAWTLSFTGATGFGVMGVIVAN
ncbi:MAG TPA: hypothetical protein VHH36_06415, partial [Candidatus Thermoplasmatota archaeon]|nr:hypothetical protein [Candidatus Thermoplasmatota archaeon]